MSNFSGTAAVDAAAFTCAGSGATTGSAAVELCRVNLQGNERAALFHGVAVSETGDTQEVSAVGWMVPDEGWVVSAQDGDLQVSLVGSPSTTVLLSVAGGETTWRGWLEISFTQNYAP